MDGSGPTKRSGRHAAPVEPRRLRSPIVVLWGARARLRPAPNRATAILAAAMSAVLVTGAAAGVVAERSRAQVRAVATARVAGAEEAAAADSAVPGLTISRVSAQAADTARAEQSAAAEAAVAQGAATLDSTPHAGDVPRAEVSAALEKLQAHLVQGESSRFQIAAQIGVLEQSTVQVQQQEASWYVQQQVAQVQALVVARSTGSVRSGTDTSSTRPATPTVPSSGKQCTSAGSGSAIALVTDLGDAINAFRARSGVPALTVVTSPTLNAHAVTMADAGGVWHSGADNLVGCVGSASAESLVRAWSRSTTHSAQMLRTDMTSLSIGAAVRDGWLYGAVSFP